jgi:hypothetical protein
MIEGGLETTYQWNRLPICRTQCVASVNGAIESNPSPMTRISASHVTTLINILRKETNMSRKQCCLLLVVGLIAAGCQSMRVQTAYDRSVAFNGLHTFCWVPPPSWLHNDPRLHMDLVEPRVRQDVEAQLQARGFQMLGDCTNADFQVTFVGALMEHFTETPGVVTVAVYQYSPDTGGEWFTDSSGGAVKENRVPSLVIEISQPGSNRVLWKGMASARLPAAVNDAQRQERIQTAVERIMKQFPPPPTK